VIAVLCKLSWMINEDSIIGDIARMSTTTVYILGVMAMFVIGFVIVVVRFYKNLLSKEAYLTHTLPFKTYQHLNCKLLCGASVIIVNVLVLIASVFIFAVGTDGFKEFIEVIDEMFMMIGTVYEPWQIIIMIAEIVVVLIISLANSLLMPYAAMSIGQRFKSKIGGAVIAYLCLYVAIETIDAIIMGVVAIVGSLDFVSNISMDDGFAIVSVVLVLSIIYTTVITAALYIISRTQLSNHLNLE